MSRLTPEEYKKLAIDLTVQIAPELLRQKPVTSEEAGEMIALYATDIANAAESHINSFLRSDQEMRVREKLKNYD